MCPFVQDRASSGADVHGSTERSTTLSSGASRRWFSIAARSMGLEGEKAVGASTRGSEGCPDGEPNSRGTRTRRRWLRCCRLNFSFAVALTQDSFPNEYGRRPLFALVPATLPLAELSRYLRLGYKALHVDRFNEQIHKLQARVGLIARRYDQLKRILPIETKNIADMSRLMSNLKPISIRATRNSQSKRHRPN